MQDEHTAFFYSVFDSTQVPTYEPSNEFSQVGDTFAGSHAYLVP
jgi:hypothetical protein